MVKVCNLVKYYGKKLAVDNISFNINKGEIVGLLGSNGAGKSTTMNIITGYIAATGGTVTINGYDVLKDEIKAKSQIGYLPEQPPLYLDMTVKSYLSFIYDLKKVKLDKSSHINEICESVGISDVYNRHIKKLSKGYKQRIGIAQALIGYPPIIILDEPTVGLDPKQIISIRNLVKNLAKDHTVIFSSHILSEVQVICDRVIVIDNGKVVADKNTSDLVDDISTNQKLVIDVEGNEDTVMNLLKDTDGVTKVEKIKNIDNNLCEYILECDSNNDTKKAIFTNLAKNNLPITKLDNVDINLENAFLKLTEKSNEEDLDNKVEDEVLLNETNEEDL